MKKSNIYIVLIITMLISFICGSLGTYITISNKKIGQVIPNIAYSTITLDEDNTISNSVNKVYDAVVVVEGFTDNQLSSTGTGFIYKKDEKNAYIMTNHHVVNGSEKIKVILSDKTELDAKVKGSEAYSDIAVLTVDNNKIKSVAEIGNSEKLKVGDTLFTVGSPEGADYAGTVTKGILSGKDRLVAVALSNSSTSDYYMKVLQTDAAINPGNSGGPICNINGEVIGITNMKLVDSTVEGMGFAIPIEDALHYAEIFEKGNSVNRPYFGIAMSDITNSYYLWQNNVTLPKNITSGVVVIEVSNNSPASKAGFQKGDVIIELEGNKISSLAEFRYELYKHQPSEKINVKFIRNNKKLTTSVTLEENKNQ